MMEPMQTSTFKTVNELLDSKYEMIIGNPFNYTMFSTLNYQNALRRRKIFFRETSGKEIGEDQSSAIFPCRNAEIYWRYEKFPGVHFYILPERVSALTNYVQLDVGFLNPFLSKIQHIMDLSFEAGLTKAWRVFNNNFIHNYTQNVRGLKLNRYDEPRDVLDFSQIWPICVVLLIGHSIALVAFLYEVFYHDFVRPVFVYRENNSKFKILKINRFRVKKINVRECPNPQLAT